MRGAIFILISEFFTRRSVRARRDLDFNAQQRNFGCCKTIFMGLCLVLMSKSSMGGQAYLTVGFHCMSEESKLVVWFRGYEDERGRRALENLGENGFDPQKLISFKKGEDEKYKIQTQAVTKVCRAGSKKYVIEIMPLVAPNFHPEGFCATRIGARVIVKLEGRVLVDEGYDACREVGEVITDVVISPKRKTIYKRIDAINFFDQ